MPLSIGTRSTPTTPLTPTVPFTRPATSANGPIPGWTDIPQLTWTGPDGVAWALGFTQLRTGGVAYFAMPGVRGLGNPPRAFTTDPAVDAGVMMRKVRSNERLITLPLYVEGVDHGTFLGVWRALAQSFASTESDGPGTLAVARPDGTVRVIDAYYQDGFDHDPQYGVRQDTLVLTLYCPSPYWRDPAPTPFQRAYAAPGLSFLSPFPTVSSAQQFGATVMTNRGGVDAPVDWTITGPAGQITAANGRTGESWTLDATTYRGSALTGAETVTILGSPPVITGPDGTSWLGALNLPGGVLWRLKKGDNAVTFTVTGANSGTKVSASFTQRYQTA